MSSHKLFSGRTWVQLTYKNSLLIRDEEKTEGAQARIEPLINCNLNDPVVKIEYGLDFSWIPGISMKNRTGVRVGECLGGY
jgi:hypothetical protein